MAELDIYWIGLLALLPGVALVAGRKLILRSFKRSTNPSEKDIVGDQRQREALAKDFRRTFLQVYLLVMGSEWLQGPYLYSVLRDEKHLSPNMVAILYTATYSTAALFAPFTGILADRFGRRAACLTFCAIHSLSSLSVLSEAIPILVLGRMLGGVGITLLWTAFESWMVTEYNARGLGFGQTAIRLSDMFGIMTTANCINAILAGVLAHCVVLALGSKTDPFMLGLALDAGAALLMLRTWKENRGVGAAMAVMEGEINSTSEGVSQRKSSWFRDLMASLQDRRILILSMVSSCFEGTIFLLMFCWPGALKEAYSRGSGRDQDSKLLPYGVIFANFMAAMVLGALAFNILMRRSRSLADPSCSTSTLPTALLSSSLMLAGLCFLAAAFAKSELQLFVAFLLLEACNGMYVPSIAYQRGRIVKDSGRASVYGLMNLPLFLFVIAALLTTAEDGGTHRFIIFIFCAVLLLIAAVVSFIGLRDSQEGKGDFIEVPGFDKDVDTCEEEKV
ncbi:hypothetical protein JX266_013275 [Neoarthrinium moseri]|nr:hypothetical protein JX266_013275 [Neoarthrinium moseri]